MKKLIILLLVIAPLLTAAQTKAPSAVKIIKRYEGCALKAYKCPAGVTTIGFGNTRHAKIGKTISMDVAEIYLIEDMRRFENYVDRAVARELPENEYSALVSASFNLGYFIKGDFANEINRGAQTVPARLKKYNKAKGKELKGLTRRRNTEATLYEFNYLDFDRK